MKFTEHLSAHITPEWRKQYISYEEMKQRLYDTVEEAPSADAVEPEVFQRHFATFDESFFQFCDGELKKINTFFSEKLAEATRKYAALSSELKACIEADNTRGGKSAVVPKKGKPNARKLTELRLAFSEYYLSLVLLQSYQELNTTGFRKILKKHDKLMEASNGTVWRTENVESSVIYTNKDIERLIQDTEAIVTRELEGGDRQKAMKRLRVPPLGEQQSPWTTFKVGLFSGSFIVLFLAVILSAIFHEVTSDNLKIAFRLYRGPLLLVEFLFLMGVNVYGWRSSGVNHVLIFELDPRNHLSEQHLMELAAIFGVVWTLSLLSFLYSSALSIQPFVNPFALTIIMIVFLLNPLRVFRHEARFWLLKILGRIIAAPFFRVNFADFWLADQLNSLSTALIDFHFLVCFYITNGDWSNATDASFCTDKSIITKPLVNCLPAWFRFAQCLRRYYDSREAFPHLVNAGKYSTTFFVVIFTSLNAIYADQYENKYQNPFFYLWLVFALVNSLYSYTWDIRMDWGLFDKNPGENQFLREEVVYSSTTFYYFAILEDLVLRFSWAISYVATDYFNVNGDLMTSITAPLEVFRRFVWNFFRLENEHLNNCGKFRAVRDISIAPIDSSDQAQILRMMDLEDGVDTRKKQKQGKSKTKDDKLPLIGTEESMDSAASSPKK